MPSALTLKNRAAVVHAAPPELELPKGSPEPPRPKLPRLVHRPRRKRSRRRVKQPALRFTPTAWAKLLFLRDLGVTEIGGFGVSAADDLLCVEDIRLVRQFCSAVTVALDDTAVAEFFDEQVDLDRSPEQFARIWVHTHPGTSPAPSSTDEETFQRVFGRCDWAVMFIIARGGRSYARLQFGVGPRAQIEIPVTINWHSEFAAADPAAWEQEYAACVRPDQWCIPHGDGCRDALDALWPEGEESAS